jgi:hypothetical protein
VIAFVVAAHLAAFADDARVRIAILRDPGVGCPGDDDILDKVRGRVGADPFRDDGAGREVRVGLARDDRGVVAKIAMFSPNGLRLGMRVLRAKECDALVDDLVLAVAIAIDPLLLVRARPRALAGSGARPRAPGADDDDAVPVDDAAPPSEPASRAHDLATTIVAPSFSIPAPAAVTGRTILGVSAGVGVIATPSLRGEISLDYGVLDVDGGVRFDLPSRYPIGPGALIDVSLIAGEGAACLDWDVDAVVQLRGCGALEGGALVAAALGLDGARAVTAPWFAVGGRGALDVRFWPELGLILEGDLLAPLSRPRFVDDVTRQVYAEPSPVVWDIAVGAEIQLR